MANEASVCNNDVGTKTSLVVAVRLRLMKSKRERERLSSEFMIVLSLTGFRIGLLISELYHYFEER